jgi:peptidoglycan/LPS O-acetylase OafA/YrhL
VAFVFPECRSASGEKLLAGSFAVALGGYTFSAATAYLILLSRAASPLGRGLSRTLGLRVFHPLAQISYAAYLFHPLVIGPLAKGLGFDFTRPWLSYGRLLGASIAATLACAAVIFLVVELPIMKLRPPRAG